MPQIGANFQFTSRQPNFERDQFDTIAHMAECTICDEGHICYCLETHKTYRFRTKDDNGNTKTYDNSEGGLGYWEEFQPGGGGGEGTITGATIGSGSSAQQVPESGGVLKFPAYPTVPITGIKDANNNTLIPDGGIVTLPTIPTVPINSIAKKTNDTNPITPNQGRVNLDLTAEDIAYNTNKTIKGKLNDIDKLIKDLTPDPSESSSTTIDLNLYSDWEDTESEYHSFIYDSSAIYVYETSSTSRITKTVSNVDHAVFKVSDRDIYIDYIINTSGNDTIYTANAIYNSSTLPSDFKEQFELGVYALIYRIIGRSGDSIPYGKTIITDTENKVLNVVYRDVVDNNVTKHQLITRAFDKNRIYIYETPDATYTKGYKFKASYGTSDSGFNTLNKLFGGGGDASDIAFNNISTGLSSTNVQAVIEEVANKLGYAVNPQVTINTNPTKNEYYDFTANAISSLDISNIDVENTNEILILFLTSINGCSLTLKYSSSPKPPQRIIGSTSLANSQVYLMSIIRGVVCVVEAPIYVQSVSNS